MSLIKRPYMTEKKLAANRSNGGRSLGPATKEGMEICATARLRHGLYAQAQETALAGLGEDPADFEELLAGLREEFTPAGAFQERLVNRLARVLWLVERADRSLEGEALRRARIAEMGRDNRLHARMMRLKMTAETLRSLARSVAGLALRHHTRRPGCHQETASGRGGGRNGRDRLGLLLSTARALHG